MDALSGILLSANHTLVSIYVFLGIQCYLASFCVENRDPAFPKKKKHV